MLKYIELHGDKTPVTKLDTFVLTYDQYENAGLLLNGKTVVVDFDNDNVDEQKIVDYLLQHFPTQSVKTTRGTHLYYRVPKGVTITNGADKITVGGFQADFKTGATSYTVVKKDGNVREGAKQLTLKDLPDLPLLAQPLPKSKNISGLGDGDGRNNALFYHLRLIREQLPGEDYTEVAEFINDVVFGVPFGKRELEATVESVGKAEIESEGQYNGKPGDMISYGRFIVKQLDIKIYQQQLYFKEGKNYSSDHILLQQNVNSFNSLKKPQHSELVHQLYTYGKRVNPKANFSVRLRNGTIVLDTVVDVEDGFTPFYLDVSFDSEAYDKEVDDFLNFIANDRKDLRIVLEEIIGHILLVQKFPHKIFFLTGSGANGKSTFIEMITKFTGELSSHVDINNFDDGTSLASLIGKVVNVADDVDAIYLEKSKNLKTMASGNTVGARAIYSQPVTIKNTATLIFTANEPPTFKDKSDGIGRRLLIVPFENKVKNRRHDIDELLSTEQAKSYLLNIGLEAIGRIIKNKWELSISKTIEVATKEYHKNNDSVLGYVTEYSETLVGNPLSQVYDAYDKWCEDSNLRPIGAGKFSRRLETLGYHVKRKKMVGKMVNTVIKEGKNDDK